VHLAFQNGGGGDP